MWPRLRISIIKSGTAVGFEGPQSPAELTISRSGPYISTISAARSGVHLLTGYKVIPAQKPASNTGPIIVLRFEAESAARLEEIKALFFERIERIEAELGVSAGS